MLKRHATPGLLLALAALFLVLAATASAYTYKRPSGQDCGKATVIGGFGGPRPTNVAANAVPEIHTFIHRGTISCAKARNVMTAFEKSFLAPGAAGKGISPRGWKCAFNASLRGQACSNSKHVLISNAIVYVTPK
jgi:hypothetical protein